VGGWGEVSGKAVAIERNGSEQNGFWGGGIKVCSSLNRAERASQQNSEAMPGHGRNL